jgi:tRNA pseudouridine38-40 synthase
MPRTFLATLHFDGARFVGWQRQREGRTVQQEFEAVLARLAGHPVRVHGAGRTDTGVHALGLGASFELPERWTPSALLRALDALVPDDCFVESVREVRGGFHARKCATERRYRYLIGTDRLARSPFRRRFEWALGRELDQARLEDSARRLHGTHDFKSFSVERSVRPHTRCQVRQARWDRRSGGQGWLLEIAADRFLHHMVRMLVGTMVEIALERRPMADLDRLLAREPGTRTSPPAPPHGLYFVTACYPDEWFLPASPD